MPKLIVDNLEVEAPVGTTVLEAARQAGIVIPHFCYHPALGNAGACRMCAVRVLAGPVKGIQMSCMLPIQEGMVVSTTDPDAVEMRRHVIEWLMINHPHDCPVCDEGGECLLQDYTVAGGHGIRRYRGSKRTHVNQYLGEFVQHEMNRCIQCYRCVRFYQEFAGGDDLGVMGRAAMVYFGRFGDGPLRSPFSGNLPDICPTGVFTDRTARFRARYWDYDMAPSVCPHCSLGCSIIPAARYRELLKIMARRNDHVNGWFICDRGRFSDHGVNSPDRPRTPLVDGRETGWDEALDALAVRIGELCEVDGPGSIAIVGSPRMSLEGNILLAMLAELIDAGALCYFTGADESRAAMAALALLEGGFAVSMKDVACSDCIALVGCDPAEDGPMMLLAVRQAWRRGARVFVVDDGSGVDPLRAVSVDATMVGNLDRVPFGDFANPVIIAGARPAGLTALEEAESRGIGAAVLLPGPNSFGAAVLARVHAAVPLKSALASERIRGILAFEADIESSLVTGCSIMAAVDRFPTEAVRAAGIFLPAAAWVEMDGTFVNNEGRAQRFHRVMEPGLPIRGLDPAMHPPRLHRRTPPGGEPRPTWRIIADLAERLGGERIEEPLTGRWEFLRALDPEGEGVRIK